MGTKNSVSETRPKTFKAMKIYKACLHEMSQISSQWSECCPGWVKIKHLNTGCCFTWRRYLSSSAAGRCSPENGLHLICHTVPKGPCQWACGFLFCRISGSSSWTHNWLLWWSLSTAHTPPQCRIQTGTFSLLHLEMQWKRSDCPPSPPDTAPAVKLQLAPLHQSGNKRESSPPASPASSSLHLLFSVLSSRAQQLSLKAVGSGTPAPSRWNASLTQKQDRRRTRSTFTTSETLPRPKTC